MHYSIIIVNWNTRDLLAGCLASVGGGQLSITSHQSPFSEVIVVDNASTDGSAAMVRERFPQVQLIENPENVGFARANNQALHVATGRYLLLLNSDTEVFPGALQALFAGLETHPQAGAAGPQVFNPDGTVQNCYGSLPSVASEIVGPYALDFLTKPWGRFGGRMSSRAVDEEGCQVVDRVSFACTMIRRTALDQVGLLDERFEFYSEDYDWFMRLRNAGWQTIFCPQAQIVHHWGASSSQRSEWSLRQLYRSKRLYFAKHHGAAAETALRIGLSCRFALKWLLGAVKNPLDRQSSARQMALYRVLSQDMRKRLTP